MGKPIDKTDIHLHCGAPKTGTTSLSFFFQANEDRLTANNIFFPHRFAMRGDVDPLHQALVACRRPSTEAQGITQAKERLSELFEKHPRTRLLISNESLLGEPFEPDNPEFYPHAERVAPILKEIFDGYQVSISFLTRDFATFIPSYYVQLVRRGSFQSLVDFANSLDRDTLTWRKPIAALTQAFGEQQVAVSDYESFAIEPDMLVQSVFSKSLDIDMPTFTSEGFRRNRSFGGVVLRATRLLNYATSKLPRQKRDQYRKFLRRSLIAPLSRLARGNKPALPPEIVEELKQLSQ